MMRLLLIASTLCGVLAFSVSALETKSLDGLWSFRFEEGKSLEDLPHLPTFAPNDRLPVPGCWDAMSHYYNQRGTGCYRTHIHLDSDVRNAFLVVDGVGIRSKFWIDGREIGFCKMPWTRFDLSTGALKAGDHELVAAIDSLVDNTKVKLFWDFYDFYAFGGFYHGVKLELVRAQDEIRRLVVRTRDYTTGRVELEVQYAETGPETFTSHVSFDEGPAQTVTFKNRRAEVVVPQVKLWSPETPHLHVVSLLGPDKSVRCRQRFGVRQVGTAKGRITLNGKPIYLKGVNRHEAHYEFGASTPVQVMYEDVKNVKDLGGNFIRGSHYAQCDALLTLCDELGVLVWEESLGWGNGDGQLKDREFCDLQVAQTRLMVRNSINHPSVIISAFLNEPQSGRKTCKALVDRLIETIRAEDSGHLVTFACSHWWNDICHDKTDILAYNVYPGWYSHQMKTGSHEELRRNIRQCHADVVKRFRDKYHDQRPILVSETGVKADYGVRDPRGKAQYTEDFQAEYERLMLEEIFGKKEIAGIAIWQFTDAKTYTRVGGITGRSYGVNTGGLYDLYRRPKLVVDVIRELFTAKSAND